MIERYLAELAALLPRTAWRRRRILEEVEGHLRDAAREHGEEEALRRFGDPATVARGFAPAFAASAARVAGLLLLPLLALPVLTYPIVENALPPAPWPEDGMPSQLAWKQDAALVRFAVALGAGAVALGALRRAGPELLAAVGVSLAALVAASTLQVALALQWPDEVPGTPWWLALVACAQLAATVAGVVPLAIAATLRARTATLAR